MKTEPGRWIRVPKRLRDELEGPADHAAASEVVSLWDDARTEDWIAQLVEINRRLVAENRKLLAQRGRRRLRRLA